MKSVKLNNDGRIIAVYDGYPDQHPGITGLVAYDGDPTDMRGEYTEGGGWILVEDIERIVMKAQAKAVEEIKKHLESELDDTIIYHHGLVVGTSIVAIPIRLSGDNRRSMEDLDRRIRYCGSVTSHYIQPGRTLLFDSSEEACRLLSKYFQKIDEICQSANRAISDILQLTDLEQIRGYKWRA